MTAGENCFGRVCTIVLRDEVEHVVKFPRPLLHPESDRSW